MSEAEDVGCIGGMADTERAVVGLQKCAECGDWCARHQPRNDSSAGRAVSYREWAGAVAEALDTDRPWTVYVRRWVCGCCYVGYTGERDPRRRAKQDRYRGANRALAAHGDPDTVEVLSRHVTASSAQAAERAAIREYAERLGTGRGCPRLLNWDIPADVKRRAASGRDDRR